MKLKAMALCMCAMLAVAACDKKEDETDNQENATSYKRLSKITFVEGTERWSEDTIVSSTAKITKSMSQLFEWQGDHLTGIKDFTGYYIMSVDYSGERPAALSSGGSEKYALSYNGKGLVESCERMHFHYDADGNLVRCVIDPDGGAVQEERTYKWQGGNMVGRSRVYDDGEPREETFDYNGKINPWAGIPKAVATVLHVVYRQEEMLSKNIAIYSPDGREGDVYDGDYLICTKTYYYESEDGSVKEYEASYYEYTDGTGRTEISSAASKQK